MHFTLVSTLLAAMASVDALSVPATADASTAEPPPANSTILTPASYTIIVDNADCPCQRGHLRFCTRFRREGVLDGHCYPVSHYVQSMRVYDPLISERNRLSCKVYQGLGCEGVTMEMTFWDNTLCREPRITEKVQYRSFSCYHEGW
ncbi:hypothetical protein TPAR_06605 [Tolypocladium paradoxum]|uniref:Uncharacterized protein n=1 Tax=Tolypocladium paradoxum TaxID=94208 RepID=A0A2S4KSN4_9HYPO|nr:hypothetical protein TPAR_06605 [Tolypocladium paradoxum]